MGTPILQRFFHPFECRLIFTILDPNSETSGPIEGDQHALDNMASGQDLSERSIHQPAGIGGDVSERNAKPGLYITGEVIGHCNRVSCLNHRYFQTSNSNAP